LGGHKFVILDDLLPESHNLGSSLLSAQPTAGRAGEGVMQILELLFRRGSLAVVFDHSFLLVLMIPG